LTCSVQLLGTDTLFGSWEWLSNVGVLSCLRHTKLGLHWSSCDCNQSTGATAIRESMSCRGSTHVKVQQFYGLRVVFAFVTTFCETLLVYYVQKYRSSQMAKYLILLLFASAGMFVASTGTSVFSLLMVYLNSLLAINLCNVWGHTGACVLVQTSFEGENHSNVHNAWNHIHSQLAFRSSYSMCPLCS
jgi:hypothetical protein